MPAAFELDTAQHNTTPRKESSMDRRTFLAISSGAVLRALLSSPVYGEDAEGLRTFLTLSHGQEHITHVHLAANGDIVTVAGKTVSLWRNGKLAHHLIASDSPTENVQMTNDGKTIALYSTEYDEPGCIRVFDATKTPSLLYDSAERDDPLVKNGRPFDAWTLSGDGSLLVFQTKERGLTILDLRTRTEKNPETRNWNFRQLTMSPKNTRLLSIGWDGQLTVWDTETLKPLWPGERTSSWTARNAVFTPDGTQIVTLSQRDKNGADLDDPRSAPHLCLWTTDTAELLSEFSALPSGESFLAMHPDGSRVACAVNERKIIDPQHILPAAFEKATLVEYERESGCLVQRQTLDAPVRALGYVPQLRCVTQKDKHLEAIVREYP